MFTVADARIQTDFENEQVEMMKSNPPVDLTPDLWVRISLIFTCSRRS